jgi:hypothetical protein
VVGTTAVLLGALAVGTAYGAGSRSSKNTINGCVNDRTGVLRVIDPAKGGRCDGRRGWSHETAISWSQSGGSVGPQGPAGPPGPRGPSGGSAGSGGLTNLDQLAGLPCGSGSQAGVVKIRIAPPTAGSGIALICQTGATEDPSTRPTLTPPPPMATVPPMTTEPPVTIPTLQPTAPTATTSPDQEEGVVDQGTASPVTGTLRPVTP